MSDFSRFDRRGYARVPVVEGYKDWQPTYEDTVEDLPGTIVTMANPL